MELSNVVNAPATFLAGVAGCAGRALVRSLVGLSALLVLCLGCPARAFASGGRVAVWAEGPGAVAMRTAVIEAVPKGTEVADPTAFQVALANRGQKGPFGKQLDGAGRLVALTRIRGAAHTMDLAAVVVARVTKVKGGRRVLLLVVQAGGDVDVDTSLNLGVKAEQDRTALAAALSEPLSKYGAPPLATKAGPTKTEAAPENVAKDDSAEKGADKAPAADNVQRGPSRPLFELELGGGVGGRRFDYKDGITSNLRTYDLFPAPLLTVGGQVYPFATSATGILGDIGLVARYTQLPFVKSTVDGTSLSTTAVSYFFGIHGRTRLGMATVGISAGYAHTSTTFSKAAATLESTLPNEGYDSLRAASDVRAPFGPVALLGSFGFRFVMASDGASTRFRTASANGLDAEIGGGVTLARGFELRLLGSYERYFLSFKPRPGDAYVAGGALDQYFGVRVALAYAL